MFNIMPINQQFSAVIQQKIDLKTKPLGALGQLESCAKQLTLIFSKQLDSEQALLAFKPVISKPSLVVFAGDHGVASQGVSIAPSTVTSQMVANFAAGGAAINVFCRQLGWQLEVVDAGTLTTAHDKSVHNQRLGEITAPLNTEMAMSRSHVEKGFELAKQRVHSLYEQGSNTIAFGEMGIGNTTSAAALMAALLSLPANQCVGKGTGVSDEVIAKKIKVVEQALQLHQAHFSDPLMTLAALGGFEIVQITGAILAAAELGMAVIVDGFICTAAALVATRINANARDYMLFAHASDEQGHKTMLNAMHASPLLQLDLRLGEGTGAALALPLLQASLAFYNDMASFADANVEQVV
ncbi:nicotinate-nucleotide--dimethylbenzimidazole phosphoribosyltransferase [Pseudoalteromonas sp. MEBiC 03607]|jgi:nicotinate-nucleotide--dimethylbenzimidazole phosphoribosyltransferase|uniref:nicotinate-nucleotide--dimethylbenzimidazole phosphoribosyltransferase n=1 Tax=unclassified Pseudoalteromonas TaxID=194690 RepID=UPI001093395C|nr:nicotinate-nucleotide--dimethylbenzimidazole phosphoribosyltransferase [Pseudoalteromonas sp. MEBiC 03607]TGV19712.1 nicotinate-nucleotide--dimethylbenzimidazole phosphoribosyltransferase [Pseudoalteromonas sp. MEBiC 03607]